MPKAIREIAGAGPQELTDDILTATQPIVLRGVAAGWPMVRAARESHEQGDAYLRRFYGDATTGATVGAMLGPPEAEGRFFYNEDMSGFNFYPVHAKLTGVLDEIRVKRDMEKPPTVYVLSLIHI